MPRINLVFVVECCGAQWLRHCITNRKIAGSIPDGVIGIFHWHISFGSTMALIEMSIRNTSLGEEGRCAVRTNLQPSCTDCLNSRSPKFLDPSGPVKACNGIALWQWVPFVFVHVNRYLFGSDLLAVLSQLSEVIRGRGVERSFRDDRNPKRI
jgi:hypothetical protein